MGCPKMFLFMYPCLIQFLVIVIARTITNEELKHFCSNSSDNQISNGTYSSNIQQAFESIISLSSTNSSGFYSVSEGQNTNQVNAIGLCRGDISPHDCNGCFKNTSWAISHLYCPTSKEAFIWFDYCMLRYSYRNILNSMESEPYFPSYNDYNISDYEEINFNQTVHNLLDRLSNEAASGDRLKFATGNSTAESNLAIYALVQCTPDISKEKCRECLNIQIARLPDCCLNKNLGIRQGARILSPSCNIRYEKDLFFYSEALLSPPPLPSPPPGKKKLLI